MTPDGIKRLMLDEGSGPIVGGRLIGYWDSNAAKLVQTDNGWPTACFGRNLASRGFSFSEASMLLKNDINDGAMTVARYAPFAYASAVPASIPDVWADVLEMIQYNTGNIAAWPHLIAAMRNGNTNVAVNEIITSDTYKGKGFNRYSRFSNAILYRRWAFSDAEETLFSKWLAMG